MDYLNLTAPRFFVMVVARRLAWTVIKSIIYPHLILDAIRVAISYSSLIQLDFMVKTDDESIRILEEGLVDIKKRMSKGEAWYRRNDMEDMIESDINMAHDIELQLNLTQRWMTEKGEVADVDGSFIRDLFIAGIILLLLWRCYKKTAIALQAVSCLVEVHFASLKADNNFQFYFSLRWPGSLFHLLDYLSLVALIITHRFVWGRMIAAKKMFAIKVLRYKEYDPEYAFVDACGKGDKAAMKRLLEKYHEKININARSGRAGNTGLHAACAGGHVNIVQSLLDCEGKNVRIGVENYEGVMPLTLAAGGGHALIVKKLLRARGMRLVADHAEKAVVAAVENEKFDCAKMILGEFQARNEGRDLNKTLKSIVNSGDKKQLQNWLRSKNEAGRTPVRKEEKLKSKEEVLNTLRGYFECTICYEEFTNGEIYSCANDHWLCADCKLDWNEGWCPTCRADLGEGGPARRHMAEKILVEFQTLGKVLTPKPHVE